MTNTAFDKALDSFDRSNLLRRTTTELPVLTSRPTARSAQASRPTWQRFAWPVAAVLAIAAVSAVTKPWKLFISAPAAASEHRESLRTVSVVQPSPATSATVVLPATIRPWQTAVLNARVSGYLKAWHVDLGARVK